MTEDNLLGEFKQPETEAGYFKKLLLGVIDGAIVFGVFYMLYRFLPYNLRIKAIRAVPPYVVFLLLLILYNSITLLGFNQTIAMMFLKVKLLTKDHEELSKKQKLAATFLIIIKEVKYFNTK